MGCDIHITVESRNRAGVWTEHEEPAFMSNRSYAVFSALAGVRQRIPAIEPVIPENRGLPEDFKWHASEYYEEDGHSANWLWLYEMDRYSHRPFDDDLGWLKGWFVEAVTWMRTLGASDDVRMVFFFDN